VTKKEAEEDFDIQRPYNRNSVHVGCNIENGTSNNGATGTITKSLRQLPEQHTGKARN
jgi:hypothetical protein